MQTFSFVNEKMLVSSQHESHLEAIYTAAKAVALSGGDSNTIQAINESTA